MKKLSTFLILFIISFTTMVAQQNFESDIIKTSQGDLEMYFIGHGTLTVSYTHLTLPTN